jgi:hypothetical protein
MVWNDINNPEDNQKRSKFTTWDQILFIFFRFLFIFVLTFIISLLIFANINIAGHNSGYMDGIGFIIVYAAILECIIAILLILSLVMVFFRTEKGRYLEKIKFTSKWEYLLPIGIASIFGLMATL